MDLDISMGLRVLTIVKRVTPKWQKKIVLEMVEPII